MDHDGGVDDYISTALLLTMQHVRVIGVVVTPADCYIKPAVSATRKILGLMGRSDVPVAESTVRGLNPFPRIFRRDAFSVDWLPVLNERDVELPPLLDEPGQDFLVRALREAPEPVTILETGPLTSVAEALDKAPDIEAKIREIVWMGGALEVPGNVDKTMEGGQDGSAEWNVYWDPPGAARVWKTNIPIVMCPLDITNLVPITKDLVREFCRRRRFPLADLAASCWALVAHQQYYAWDVLTTAYIGRPDIFTIRDVETEIITEGMSQGRTRITAFGEGRATRVLHAVDLDAFYAYLLEQWSTHHSSIST